MVHMNAPARQCCASLILQAREKHHSLYMMSQKAFTVSIVGGGIAGLVCAVGLARAGLHVHVFESAVSV